MHGNLPLASILNIILFKLKKTFFLLLIFLSIGCENKTELAMERGIQFYEWDMIEKAVLEFKHVIHRLGPQSEQLDYKKIKLLSRAHHNLAVAYAKKKWYTDAVNEAQKAFDLFPTDENRKLVELIQIKVQKKTGTKPRGVCLALAPPVARRLALGGTEVGGRAERSGAADGRARVRRTGRGPARRVRACPRRARYGKRRL